MLNNDLGKNEYDKQKHLKLFLTYFWLGGQKYTRTPVESDCLNFN